MFQTQSQSARPLPVTMELHSNGDKWRNADIKHGKNRRPLPTLSFAPPFASNAVEKREARRRHAAYAPSNVGFPLVYPLRWTGLSLSRRLMRPRRASGASLALHWRARGASVRPICGLGGASV
jgi:hypothetical protein